MATETRCPDQVFLPIETGARMRPEQSSEHDSEREQRVKSSAY